MRKAVCALTSLILAFCLAACRPTPQSAAVADKQELEKKISEPAVLRNDAIEKIPKNYRAELEYQNGVEIDIDADIELPDTDVFPVVEAAPYVFTQEEAQRYADILMRGKPIYQFNNVRTKSDVQADIIRIKKEMEDAEKKDIPDETRRLYIEDLKERLDQLNEEYEDAPDTKPEDVPATVEFEEDSFGNQSIAIQADLGKSVPANLQIWMSDDNINTMISFSDTGGTRYEENIEAGDSLPGTTLTRRDSLARAEAFLRDLGIEDMMLAKTEAYADLSGADSDSTAITDNRKKCYKFCFCREVCGIPVTLTDYYYGLTYGSETYDNIWAQEQLEVWVDEGGIYAFLWGGRGDSGKVVNENVSLLDFDSILKEFEKQIFYKRTWDDKYIEDSKITVKQIKLGMMRVRLRENKYVYMPVWDFIGDWTYKDGGTEYGEYDSSFLTLNAIDGGAIDRELGY